MTGTMTGLLIGRVVSQLSAGASWEIDRSAHSPNDYLEHGIRYSDGDGTVPLLSLGGLCSGGWQESRLNPSNIKVQNELF